MTRTTQKRRRRTQRRKRRSEKRDCSDTLEESSSADEVDARRKRARYYKESPSCYLTHIQSDTSLHLQITTVRTHGRCSHDMWHHERVSVYFTITRTLRLKSEVSQDLSQSSPVLALLNDFAHDGCAGVRLEEARNPGPATHDRDRVAEPRNVRHRRTHNLQLTVPPDAAPAPMPNSRRPPQARPRQPPRENPRCAQCGPDPSAFRGALDHGLMLHMVQEHGGQQLIQESVAQQRHLDRAACVA